MMEKNIKDSNIVIIDDHSTNVTLLKKVLQMDGYQNINTFEDPRFFLETCSITFPDLLLLDIMMPYMDGFDIIKEVKKNNQNQLIPTIVITAHNDASKEDLAYDLGVIDYVTKPFDIRNLTKVIHNALLNT